MADHYVAGQVRQESNEVNQPRNIMSQQSDRRSFLATCTALGVGTTLFPGVLWARIVSGEEITPQVIADAEQIAGVQFDAAEREMMVDALKGQSATSAGLVGFAIGSETLGSISSRRHATCAQRRSGRSF